MPSPNFDQAWHDHGPWISALTLDLATRCGRRDLAPDLLQEVAVELWRALPRHNPRKGSLRTWARPIVERVCARHLSQELTAEQIGGSQPGDDEDDEGLRVDRSVQVGEEEQRKAIAALTPGQRQALYLRAQGASYSAIGKARGTSTAAAHRLVTRARQRIEELLSSYRQTDNSTGTAGIESGRPGSSNQARIGDVAPSR